LDERTTNQRKRKDQAIAWYKIIFYRKKYTLYLIYGANTPFLLSA